ncbi:MAG TPA: bacterial transcriptional activator domain-containing protein, partial [Chondromyces sp.]|nr:bacterial transcriptional activator domain-containing protein [Chondromyces sp.]
DNKKTLHYLQLQLKFNPYLEEIVKQIMLLSIKLGNRFEAISVYRKYKSLLSEELGIEPNASLTEVFHSIS